MSGRRLIVIGAGPAGLTAAISGVRRGWGVTVLERDEVGASIRRWGPTRFFSPLAMNLPSGACECLGGKLPPDDALLTGSEFVENVLVPLAGSNVLSGCIRTSHRVVAVGRSGLTRSDLARNIPVRAEQALPLPERQRVASMANQLATRPPSWRAYGCAASLY